ncbi:FtsB family cell division protein [Lysinibacillus sp. 3P01SB]|uniref:FtsB family cell division protein n=1 Tax=Lysinibacillus sp. 3P01SB TaxID=3132284 RepID=UPI0039A65D7E
MAQRQQQEKVHRDSVKTLDNDYVRSSAEQLKKQQIKQRQKVLSRRRLAVFFVFAAVVCIALVSAMMNQNTRLAEKEEEKRQAQEELAAIKDQQEMLKLQITKLEDDEYIAKLARKEYFLSEDGEIIFTIPKEDKKEDDEQ